jgi:flagellar basal-body rod modification protein FlgD
VGGGTYTNTATDATQAARANAELDKTQFLTLLVAQLENQDPMNPIDNQDFIAQLATFSSLEQLISINEGMTRLADAIAPSGDTQ